MSMISAQCDELRAMAEIVGLAMPQAATLMMEAADTIERLREQTEDMDFQLDKWQTKAEYFKQLADLAEAENAKLRDENQSIGMAAYELGRNSMADENAKLRESLERAAGIIVDICGECPASRYEWLSSDGCAEKCWTVTEEECWIAYLTGKRWDESGAEVDR